MMPNPIFVRLARREPNDRASRELRAYARQEWNTDVSWIQDLAPRTTFRERILRWVRNRRAPDRNVDREPVGGLPTALETGPPVQLTSRTCPHPSTEELGFGGAADFLRCCACGAVLIVDGDRQWSIASETPAVPAGSSAPDPGPADHVAPFAVQ